MKFTDYLLESEAAEQAKKMGLTAASWGLWKDKDGKVVKKTVDGKLVDVKGSRANLNNYHTNIPQNKETDHDAIDNLESHLDKYITPGTRTTTDITKYGTHKTSAVHPDKAKHLHDDLIADGFQYEKDDIWDTHQYRKGNMTVQISDKPETSHKGGGKNDHLSIAFSVNHTRPPKSKAPAKKK